MSMDIDAWRWFIETWCNRDEAFYTYAFINNLEPILLDREYPPSVPQSTKEKIRSTWKKIIRSALETVKGMDKELIDELVEYYTTHEEVDLNRRLDVALGTCLPEATEVLEGHLTAKLKKIPEEEFVKRFIVRKPSGYDLNWEELGKLIEESFDESVDDATDLVVMCMEDEDVEYDEIDEEEEW